MAKEEFTVRITKKGEIFVEMEGLPPRRVKDLMKFFEETIGPARLIDTDGGDARGKVEIDDILDREVEAEAAEEHETERLRLREE
jgi:hypothetical protein